MISHRLKCIFVHIPKCGGTSLEDVIWPNDDERTVENLWMGFRDKYSNKYQTGGLQHLKSWQIREEVGVGHFNDYFKFTIVRNPWDKAVSQYVYCKKRKDLMQFIGLKKNDSFIQYLSKISRKKHVQWEPQSGFVLGSEGELLVDYVGRFENYITDSKAILDRLSIVEKEIPHKKKGDRAGYEEYYCDESREIVAEMYKDDVRIFGYEF